MRAAPARAAPGGRRGSVPGDLLNIESLPLREVLVNIYEAEGRKQPIIRSRLNLRAILAGASHAGVEVYRREYGYAFTEEEVSGISECVPRRRKNFVYRVTLEMGLCPLTEGRVQELLTDMAPTWRGSEFNAIHNNSLDFADAFLQQLGVGRLPRELGESGVAAMLAQPFSQEEADGEDPEVQAHSADRQLFCQSVACTDDDAGLLATEPANSSLDAEYFVGDVEPLPDSSDTLHELEITVARGLAQERQLGCLLSARGTEKARGSEEKAPMASKQQSVEEPRVLHRSWRHLPSVGTWHTPRLKDARQLLPSVGT